MKYVSLFVVVSISLLLCDTVYADRTVWYVHPDSALNTIQAGLDSCADNDIVLVGPGTYIENIIWPNTQGIHLIGELGPQVTIIDGDSNGTVIKLDSATGADTTTIIRGFTIRNGYCDTSWAGAGVDCYCVSPTIRENIIINNVSIHPGQFGGIRCEGWDWGPRIIANTISCNTGSGIDYDDCLGTIIDSNLISYNSAVGVHGWICNSICNNTITHNWCGLSGSAYDYADNIISYNIMDGKSISPEPAVNRITHRRYGGNTYSYNGGRGIGGIEVWATNETITHNGAGGVYGAYGAHLDSCTIAYNYGPGVLVEYAYNSHIHYCNIFDNAGYGVLNMDSVVVHAEFNWWGDETGPFHPDSNHGGLGDTVSDYVVFIPWLTVPVGVEEQPIAKLTATNKSIGATIFHEPLQLPAGKTCRVFDITGRVVEPTNITRGIYFIEVDGVVTQKVIKVR